MADVTSKIEDKYDELLEYLRKGGFWYYYIGEEDYKIPYVYPMFREAIRNANKIDPNIHVTNYQGHNHKKMILRQYKILLKDT